MDLVLGFICVWVVKGDLVYKMWLGFVLDVTVFRCL